MSGEFNDVGFRLGCIGLLYVVNGQFCRISYRFRVIRCFHFKGEFPLSAKILGGVCPLHSAKFRPVSTKPSKGTSIRQTMSFGAEFVCIVRPVRAVRVPENKLWKKPRHVFVSPTWGDETYWPT